MDVHSAVEAFLLACSADGRKEKTLAWYRSLLGRYVASAGNRAVQRVVANDVRRYIVELRHQNYSPDTVHGHIRALHRFWKWCSREYKIDNPMENIDFPKQPKPKLPKAVALDDVIKLLLICDQTPMGKRNKAIIAFLTDTGCRAAGLTGLTLEALDLVQHRAYVVEKGDNQRVVMFMETTAYLIAEWLKERDPDAPTVFHADDGAALKPGGLYQMTVRLKQRAGVTGRTNPHAFRHGFAREYLQAGGDLATLARILGHEDVNTTAAFYGIFAQDELAALHRTRSPMRKINLTHKNGTKGRF